MVMRVAGFLSRHLCMASTRAGSPMSGKEIAWRGSTMACILGTKARGAKGVWPYTIWYRMQPRLQMSEGLPTCQATFVNGAETGARLGL